MSVTISDHIAQVAITAIAWIIGIKMVVSLLTQLVAKMGQKR